MSEGTDTGQLETLFHHGYGTPKRAARFTLDVFRKADFRDVGLVVDDVARNGRSPGKAGVGGSIPSLSTI
jgi:hypothetical protein